MKNYNTLISTVLVLCTFAFLLINCTANLADIPKESADTMLALKSKGKDLLAKTLEKHTGNNTLSVQSSSVLILEDEWKGITTLFCPWPESKTMLKIGFMNNQKNGHIEFLNTEEKGDIWGFKNDTAYVQLKNKPIEIVTNTDIKLFVPGIQYLLNLPLRIPQDAAQVIYVGSKKLGDTLYDQVFVTWGTDFQSSSNYDQFVLWINQETGYVEKSAFTTREFMDSFKACVHYDNFKNVDGYIKAHTLRINSDCADDPLENDRVIQVHEWSIKNTVGNVERL